MLDTKIVFLIYFDLLWEPETERIANRDRFILMFAPITRNYGQNYGDFLRYDGELPPYVRNRLKMPRSLDENLAHLRRWQAQFKGDSFVFDYHLMWAHVGDIGYEKCAYNLFCDMKDLHKIGLGGMVSCQIQRCFLPTALPVVAMAAALWDSGADYGKVADGYYRAACGAEGPAVREAMKTLSDSCRLYEKSEPVWDEETAIKGREMLLYAVRRDPSLTELALYAEYLELLFDVLRAYSKGDKETARKTAKPLYDWMWKYELDLQGILDVQNSVLTIGRITG